MIELNCPECGKLLRIPPEYRGKSGQCNGCGAPVHVPRDALTVDQKAQLAANPKPPVDLPAPDWRNDPPSPKQLSYLADLGATPTMMRGLTKGAASELIEELQEIRSLSRNESAANDMAISQREMVKAQNEAARAIQRQTNFHKNACGCLLLILLAPLWVPALLAILVAIAGSNSAYAPDPYPATSPTPAAPVAAPVYLDQSPAVRVIQQTKRYHRPDCRRAQADYYTLTLNEARKEGFAQCGICLPDLP